jgi:O-antigen/teichoic acid export membrane protein
MYPVYLFLSITVCHKRRTKAGFKSKFYIISGLMVTIFQNTDHVMLKLMLGQAENGYYTTAVTCAGLTTFVFAAIVDSARPAVLASRKESVQKFEHNMSRTYCVMIWLALAQSVAFTLLASPIVRILYGDEYLSAIPVLRVVVWYTSFSCMGSVRNIWILAEGKQSVLWIINLIGALMNVVLNFLLIPAWGTIGAAAASVFTQLFTNFVVGFLIPSIRDNNRLLLRGLNPKLLAEFLPKRG